MINLVKMDVYRLLHSKAFKVGLIAATAIAFGSMLINLLLIEVVKLALSEDPTTTVDVFGAVFPVAYWINGVDFGDIVLTGTGSLCILASCMVSASFVSAEQTSGYTKNIAGQLPNKGFMVISKFIVTSLFYLVVLLIFIIASIICAFAFFYKYIDGYSIGTMLGGLALRLLLFLSINAIIIFLCTLAKSQSLAMIIGAIFGLGVTGLVYWAFDMILPAIKINIHVAHYMPDGISGLLNIASVGSLWVKSLIVSVIFTGAFLSGAFWIVRKRDVK